MGAVYTNGFAGRKLRDDDSVRDDHLLATFQQPHANAFTASVAYRLAATGRAVILDVHSYSTVARPYELHADQPRPRV